MNCPKCGAETIEGAKFCVACGALMEEPAQAPVEVAPVVEATPVVEAAPVAPVTPVYYQPEPAKKKITEEDLPEHFRPLGAWSYFGLKLLFAIPIVGLVFLIVFTFSRGNLNRRSFARSYWCELLVYGVGFVLLMIILATVGFSAGDVFSEMMYY